MRGGAAGRPTGELRPEWGPTHCPLCSFSPIDAFAIVHGRHFRRCPRCRLISVSPTHHLDPAAEKSRYDTHENDPSDPRYRAFLGRLVNPLSAVLEPGAEGLDFGSGPGPTLSLMMRERGFACEDYDPFFAPDEELLARSYDFIACSETAEHFFRPGESFDRMKSLLRPRGWLGIMTRLLRPEQEFESWWYIRDPSHVCFYSVETMEWIAETGGFSMLQPGQNVCLLQKS